MDTSQGLGFNNRKVSLMDDSKNLGFNNKK